MKILTRSFLLIATSFLFANTKLVAQEHHDAGTKGLDPEAVINWLKKGNTEFEKNENIKHAIDPQLRMELAKGQHPQAIILTCSDSRVSPELIFNKGLGDLFVVRVAGNVTDDAVLGSIEYSAEHLHTPLIVVMGHTNCGAIAAAVSDQNETDVHTADINNLIRTLTDKIQQAVLFTNAKDPDPIRNALVSNINYNTLILRNTHPTLSNLINKHELKVIGAVYHLETGKVEWLNY